MHIPSSMMNGAVCPVTAAMSAGGVAIAAAMAWKTEEKPTAIRFAAVGAVVFAGQMANFPVHAGTSGHLLGGVLAAALLGVPFGVLAIALVVSLQCLVFADGGISELGANILNMAILGAGIGGWIFTKLTGPSTSRQLGALGAASWFSVMMASLACSVELATADTIAFSKVAPAMLSVHALIGLGEAAMTVAAMAALHSTAIQPTDRRHGFFLVLSAGIIALLVAPFACAWPDGLESVAGTLRFLHTSAPSFVAPFPNYTIHGVSNEMLATSLAGGVGASLSFFAAWGIARLWQKRSAIQ